MGLAGRYLRIEAFIPKKYVYLIWSVMSATLKEFFIRPHRQSYYDFDLGPSTFNVDTMRCSRQDFYIQNRAHNALSTSIFQVDNKPAENCVIYLHTHHGSKLEALPIVDSLLRLGLNLCAFDFAGYGNSEGETVTLGYREADDIGCVIDYLQKKCQQRNFVLWGRSMGAVAALLYLSKEQNPRVIGGVYDSPFDSLQRLSIELGSASSNMPELLLKPVIFAVKQMLHGDIDFAELEVCEKVGSIRTAGMLVASQRDRFIKSSHSERLYKKYNGKKQLVYIDRDHNESRSAEDLELVLQFVMKLNQAYPKAWRVVLQNHMLLKARLSRPQQCTDTSVSSH